MVRAAQPTEAELDASERATATWAWEHDQTAGHGTETLPGGKWLHIPLGTVRGPVGVLALQVERLGSRLSLDQRHLLEALAGQAALAIERSRVEVIEAIIESIEDGLVVLNRGGVIVHVNDVACAILGCERSGALGHPFEALGTNHPHYIRLRAAVREFLLHPEREGEGDVGRLEDVAQRLLDVSRSRAITIALERQHVDLRAVVARVAQVFALQAAERGVSLETMGPRDALTITGDATKLTWALSNLVTNALRYTPRGGRVTVETVADDGTVRVVVSDNGPGIPADQRERVFERYVQGQDRPAGAAGLGLAIVRDIVQAHGGRVHLESEVGRGSRFMLDLPRS